MQTIDNIKVGSLVVWHGGENSDNHLDIDDIGIVIGVDRVFDDEIQIHWSVTNTTDHFTSEEVHESLYQHQMEVIQ